MKSPFKVLDGAAEVAQLNEDFRLLHEHFRYAFVVEEHFIKFYKGLFEVISFKCLLCASELFENFVLSNPVEVIFLKV